MEMVALMPVYEYVCAKCERTFDHTKPMHAPAPPCPTCGGPVEWVPGPLTFALKGGGWAASGYSKDKA